MKNRLVIPALIMTFGLTSCAQMTAKKPYTPEMSKKISFTLEAPVVAEKKELLSMKISKADLLDEKYSVNDCGTAVVAEAKPAAPAAPAAPANIFGNLASLAANVQTSAAPKTPTMGPQTASKVIEKNYLPSNMIAFKIDIKSDINHVINFEKAYFLLKDPNGKIHKAVSIGADENWKMHNWCATPEQSNKYYDRMNSINDIRTAMVLPLDSLDAYVAFAPSTRDIAGEWKLEMYEIPVATTSAGIASITDHFKSKAIVKKWETTFKKSSPTASFEKVGTTEVN